jgi:RNA polymerase sigma-70 factor, ECF subfamily
VDSVFHDLYENYHRDLYQFLFYLVKNHETAEDIVQEVYIRAMKSYQSFEGKSSEKTWLYAIARNAAMDHFRKQKSWKQRILPNFNVDVQPLKDLGPIPEEIAVQKDELQSIYQSLHVCNDNQRAVIVLRFIQDLSISETAAVLNWSESKVKTTQHRALKIIKKYMEETEEKEGNPIEKIHMD